MELVIYLVAAVVVVLILLILIVTRRKADGADVKRPRAPAGPVRRRDEAPPAVRVRRRRTGVDRLRMGAEQQRDEEETDSEDDFVSSVPTEGKIGAKKLRKLQEKEERKRMREAELEEREARKEQELQRQEEQKKLDAKREAEEAAKAEEEKKKREEKERQEYEEYLKLKEQFTVEEEGTEARPMEEDGDSLLQQFITYIKEMKSVMLEDLASHFRMKTQEVIDRIKTLQDEGRLSGVLDDRGKFIYITEDEYKEVAKFIQQRGRVSITELAECSNRLINLKADENVHRQLLMTQD